MQVGDLVVHRFDGGKPSLVLAVSAANGESNVWVRIDGGTRGTFSTRWRSSKDYEVISASR